MVSSERTCLIEGCGRRHYGHGWCNMHYRRWAKYGDPLTLQRSPRIVGTVAERFWPKVVKNDPGECWGWTAQTDAFGYGRIAVDLIPTLAQRVAWTLMVGPIPDGLCVLHSCDNPPCCNPAHLWLGTKADNNADMARKGRAGQRGERSTHAKLTEAQVLEIRRRYATGSITLAVLASEYGVWPAMISRIVNRKNWAHI